MSSQIFVVWSEDPGFPPTDQHPDAQRFTVGGKIVDSIGKPTAAELKAFMHSDKMMDLEDIVERLNDSEFEGIMAAMRDPENTALTRWWNRAMARGEFSVEKSQVIKGALVTRGLLTQARADELFD